MRAVIAVVLLAACGKKVELVGSSCADPVACLAECDSGVVVACDRGGLQAREPSQRLELFSKGHELWAIACNIGNPEACMNGAVDRMRMLGFDQPTKDDFMKDREACELFATSLAATGSKPRQSCP
jgi:hypothetical protein